MPSQSWGMTWLENTGKILQTCWNGNLMRRHLAASRRRPHVGQFTCADSIWSTCYHSVVSMSWMPEQRQDQIYSINSLMNPMVTILTLLNRSTAQESISRSVFAWMKHLKPNSLKKQQRLVYFNWRDTNWLAAAEPLSTTQCHSKEPTPWSTSWRSLCKRIRNNESDIVLIKISKQSGPLKSICVTTSLIQVPLTGFWGFGVLGFWG